MGYRAHHSNSISFSVLKGDYLFLVLLINSIIRSYNLSRSYVQRELERSTEHVVFELFVLLVDLAFTNINLLMDCCTLLTHRNLAAL
jgi:hypothetical protein